MTSDGLSSRLLGPSALVIFWVACGPALAQQTSFVEKKLDLIPSYEGYLHLVGSMAQRDLRTRSELDTADRELREAVIRNGKASGLSDEAVKSQVSQARKGAKFASARQDRLIELWAKGSSWVLIEVNPSSKSDVFSGEAEGRTVWLCDGTDLLKIEGNGFKCLRFPPHIRIQQEFPPTPLLGINYSAMPVAFAPDAPPELLAKVKKTPGWTLANVPSYTEFHGDEIQTYERESTPTHFPNYNPGVVQIIGGSAIHRVAEIRIGAFDRPFERWSLRNYHNVSGMPFANSAIWQDFQPNSGLRPRLQRTFTLKELDTDSFDDALFSRDKYVKNGAIVYENITPPKLPRSYFYRKGASWDDMSSKSIPPSRSTASLAPGLWAAGIAALGVTSVYTIRHLRKR